MSTIDLTCRGCGALLDCADLPDSVLYTLESAGLPFVMFCPQGYQCNQGDSITLQCCNQQISSPVPHGSSPAVRQAILAGLMQQCQVLQATCGGTQPSMFWNTPQTCTIICPDGTPFSYTEQAGVCAGLDLVTANKLAYQEACVLARQNRVCPGKVSKPTLYWTMDEPGAVDRVDSIHALHLIPGNGIDNWPDAVAGIISEGCLFRGDLNAPQFIDTSLKVVSSPLLGFASGGISTTFWVKININPGVATIFHYFGDPTSVSVRFNFVYDPTVSGGSVVLNVITQNFGATDTIIIGAIPLSTWKFVAVTYDPATQTILASLNGGAQVSKVLTNAIVPYTPGDLFINNFAANTLNYDMDELGLWFSTKLTPAQITQLYNGGNGARPSFT